MIQTKHRTHCGFATTTANMIQTTRIQPQNNAGENKKRALRHMSGTTNNDDDHKPQANARSYRSMILGRGPRLRLKSTDSEDRIAGCTLDLQTRSTKGPIVGGNFFSISDAGLSEQNTCSERMIRTGAGTICKTWRNPG